MVTFSWSRLWETFHALEEAEEAGVEGLEGGSDAEFEAFVFGDAFAGVDLGLPFLDGFLDAGPGPHFDGLPGAGESRLWRLKYSTSFSSWWIH